MTRVHYGYFPEASPIRVACARGWFNFRDYQVTCYPQTSGGFAAERLDSGSLHISELGSTPLALALARGVDIRVVYIDQYKADSQGIYVRPDNDETGYKGIEHPFDLIGRKLGVPFGSTMHYQVLFLLDIFGMTGKVELLNLSPSGIIAAWDDERIDAAACWGLAREQVLGGDNPGNVLVTAGVLADWGRETFNVVAVRRDFMADNPDFMEHFVSILGLLTDSFIDKLGEFDLDNVRRWTPSANASLNYMPSLADTIMKEGEEAQNPSLQFIKNQRHALDLYKQLSMDDQLSCDYLDGGRACGRPSLQHIAIQQTAQFLMDQKILHSMGKLSDMGDNDLARSACSTVDTICGGDIFTGDSLNPNLYSLGDWDGVPPFYAQNETGRLSARDTDCSSETFISSSRTQYFGDSGQSSQSPISLTGRSYFDNLDCWYIIKTSDCASANDNCELVVELLFSEVRIWSGDYIRVYSDPRKKCDPDSTNKVLLGQINGLDPEVPKFQAQGCILVHFVTDGNKERSHNDIQNIGDGFSASYKQVLSTSSLKSCNGEQWGADCSFTKHCIGTSHIDMSKSGSKYSLSSGASPYPNDLDCIWEVQARGSKNYVTFQVEYDLEPTFDYLQLFTGTFGSTSGVTAYASLSGQIRQKTYYIPTDDSGLVTIRFVTDSLGRKSGFTGSVYNGDRGLILESCATPGTSGLFCEFPHCIAKNSFDRHPLGSTSANIHPDYEVGRVVSQTQDSSVPTNINCIWPFEETLDEARGIRLRFNFPLDLEPQPVSAVGDKITVRAGRDKKVVTEVFIEECTNDDVCSYSWQTGKCDDGACTVRQSIDITMDSFSGAELQLVTDRSDGGKQYDGFDFDTLFISSCPTGVDVHCEAGAGKCVDGACICNENIPCACPCDADGLVSTMNYTLLWIFVPVVVIFITVFVWYRRRKIRKSREQKAIIQEKEDQLEAFRNSVVGMRTATTHYMPKAIPASDGTQSDDENLAPVPPPVIEKVQWCWKETQHMMSNHKQEIIAGNPADCWIKYEPSLNAQIENAYQALSDSKKEATFKTSMNQSFKRLTAFSPSMVDESKFIVSWGTYRVDIREMKQIKETTGFERDIQRIVESVNPAPEQAKDRKEIDLGDVEIGNPMPEELAGEPQMCLVKGDIIQISSQRQDGWAFGTKLHHHDEATARELVRLASTGVADANVFTDTGWFPLDTTEVPTVEELALLESKVGGTDALQAPTYWEDVIDPTVVQLHELKQNDAEYKTVVQEFMSSLKPPRFSKKVKVIGVERIQNLAMWQSYVVKRQTICYRETGGQDEADSPEVMKRALDRFERNPLWHGTNVEVMDKIIQQGFNRSFCGKNATVYGKGVYFARDSEYSAHSIYSVPDKNKVQYMLACRVIVGEYCAGVRNAVTPDIRDPATQTLYDTSVGLLGDDTMANPSIYVTYHDAQAYPEYLVKFKAT